MKDYMITYTVTKTVNFTAENEETAVEDFKQHLWLNEDVNLDTFELIEIEEQ